MNKFISAVYRARIDFKLPELSDASEKLFWESIYQNPISQQADHLESCQMTDYVEADFSCLETAGLFIDYLKGYLEDNDCIIFELAD
ncbi:hypothetical protein [Psychromonas sp. SP041]|uniref:hypothetical protein n=1 Tax=Psychromonas sp. SP041 TaxID=1365007 RepID=UPI0010C7900B|nr:hypothetical protein [Psychromonas sp. SP041]